MIITEITKKIQCCRIKLTCGKKKEATFNGIKAQNSKQVIRSRKNTRKEKSRERKDWKERMRERQRESAKTSPRQGANDEANVSTNEQRKPSSSLSKCISFSKDAKRQRESPETTPRQGENSGRNSSTNLNKRNLYLLLQSAFLFQKMARKVMGPPMKNRRCI